MINVYLAVMDDFVPATLQFIYHFNYLRGGSLELAQTNASCNCAMPQEIGIYNCFVKQLDRVAIEARMNTRILHIEGETLFATTKLKLDLPPSDNNDS